jgi:DNA-binding MarR family transcriptional regulator
MSKIKMTEGNGEQGDAERIAELFERTSRALRCVKPHKLKAIAFDLTLAQGRCLRMIKRHQNCTLRELSGHLGVRPSTACELVDRLVREELVRREQDAQDRRIIRLSLAPKGQRLFAKHKEERRQHLHTFLDRLTEQQRKEMLKALEALNDVVQQVEREK